MNHLVKKFLTFNVFSMVQGPYAVMMKKDEGACKVCKHFRRPSRPNSIIGKVQDFWYRRQVLSNSAFGKKHAGKHLLVLAVVLSLLVAVLAALQYRWLGQVSDGELGQMKSYLNATANRIGRDFDTELTDAYNAFYPELSPGEPDDGSTYANQYIRWASGAQYPNLIKSIWFATAGRDSTFALKQLIADKYKFEPCPWPAELNRLHQGLAEKLQDARTSLGTGNSNRNIPGRRTGMEMRHIDADIPALIIPVSKSVMLREEMPFTSPSSSNLIIVGLNLAYIKEQMLPEIIDKITSGDGQLNFRVQVVAGNNADNVIFFSDLSKRNANTGQQPALIRQADVMFSFFRLRSPWFSFPNQAQSGIDGGNFQPQRPDDFGPPPANEPSPTGINQAGFTPGSFDAGPNGRGEGLWKILIQHKDGSINAAVANARHRNLTIGFGVLLLLFGSGVMIVISTRRFLHLAEQQIEFVAGVTHELRTPISVICLAGENLADKVIHNNAQIANYGVVIRDEGRRLAAAIEQVLQFAGAHSYWKKQEFEPVSIRDVIDHAILDCQSMIQEQGFKIEQEIQSDLPDAIGNQAALERAVRNLLSNAIKFSGTSRWVEVKAESCSCKFGNAIRLMVRDRGVGIPHNEHASIFEPFFRGKDATTNQVRGNGLGLSLVKKIVEAHGGHISVDSKIGRGSTFTIYLPLKEGTGTCEASSDHQQVINY
jgi:signal transduction histidine kinase